MTENFVYLMKNMGNGYYKIGSSFRPHSRERTLQAQEPDVRLVAKIEAESTFERRLHRKYAARRLRGEWFALEFGDLYDLARQFGVGVEHLNPPIRLIDNGTWRAAIHRLSPAHDYTWITWRHGEFVFEMPFAMTKSQVEELVTARAFSCVLPEDLMDLLASSLRNYLRDSYEVEGERIELREVCCMATGDSRGYVVCDQHGHDRFFTYHALSKEAAANYFTMLCRYHDGYAQLRQKF